MVLKVTFLALVAFCCFAPSVNGEGCVAGVVQNLRIDASANLTWGVNPNEPCEIHEFQVDIIGDRGDEFHFKTTDTHMDVSFMEICEEWQFTITPISDGVVGFERRLVEYIPLPPSADISLRYFNVSQAENNDILLEWDLTNHTHGDCTLRYRLVVTDLETSAIQDMYVTGRSTRLSNLSPCVPYEMSIRAINRAHPTIEGPQRSHEFDIPPYPQDAPTLLSLEIGTTTINMIWRLESFVRNRCHVKSMHVDGGDYFNLEFPLEDPTVRPPVEVDLDRLRPNSMYFFRVSVENEGGISPSIPLAVQTLELQPGSE